MLAYGDARVTRRGHNRHRHRHHRRQSGGRRRGWPGGRAGTNPARVAGADARPAGTQRRRGVAAGSAGGAGAIGTAGCTGGRRFRDGAVAHRGRLRRSSDHAGAAVRRQSGPGCRHGRPRPVPGGRGRRISALDGHPSARCGRVLAGTGGGQLRAGGRGRGRLCHRLHRLIHSSTAAAGTPKPVPNAV